MKLLVAIISLQCWFHVVIARIYYVQPSNGVKGERFGTFLNPFDSIQECVDTLKNEGDECQIRAGNYHENILVTGLNGKTEKPFVIRGYGDERPILDGTIAVKPLTKWKNNFHKNIYSAKIPTAIWQLFIDGEMMTNARWPNAKWSDKTIFNGTLWSGLSKSSKRGLIVNKGDSLKKTNIDMTDAMAILNIGSFNTFVAKVRHHKANTNTFTFDDTFGDYHFKPERSRYFLEDKLELLDTAEEWFYDKNTSILYVWIPTGKSPTAFKLRGKTQSYAMQIRNSSHLLIRNIDFFATTLNADSANATFRVHNITFHSLNFKYHSYSKRMLGDNSIMQWTEVNGIYDKRRQSTWGRFTFFNNTFYGSDGLALSYHGSNVTLENNLFEYNDWTAANMIRAGGGLATIKSDSIYDLFLRNTIRYNGASVGIRPGLVPHVKLNDIYKQCWGLIQNDGAGVQVTVKQQVNCLLENNWIHDSPKYGLRFDGEPPRIGTFGTMSHNVVGRCNGLMVKGDHHIAENNLAFEKENANDDDKQGAGCALCVLKYVRKNPGEINMHSKVANNVADVANGGKIINGKGKVYPVAGIVTNNVFGKKVGQLLMDPNNNDFRPQKDSLVAKQKAGPYLYQEKMKEYWIPGRKLFKASSPIPPHASNDVKAAHRDVLMWLGGLNCDIHRVFFGENETNVAEAGIDSVEYIGSTTGDENVIYLPRKVKRGKTYFWRVDSVCNNKVVYKGDIWEFSTVH